MEVHVSSAARSPFSLFRRYSSRPGRRSCLSILLMAAGMIFIGLIMLQFAYPSSSGEQGLVKSAVMGEERKIHWSPDVTDVRGYLPIGPDGIIIKENMSPTLMESALFYYMMMPQISCKEIRRLGKHGDGGWDICIDDNFFPNKKTCLVYSFGFRNNWSFDEDVAKIYNCEVHSFNPSLQKEDHKHSHNVWFHNLGVAGTDYFLQRSGWKMQSIPTIMKTLNHTSRNLDILKLDVEGAEWEIIPNMLGTGLFNQVKQFCFELHLLGKHRRTRLGLYQVYLLLKSIYDSGFRLYYSHINRATSYTSPLTKTMRHACIEFYFVNTRHADFIAASPK